MPLEVACPHCQSRLNLNTKPGEQCRCPMCQQVFITPQIAAPMAGSPVQHQQQQFETGAGQGGYGRRQTSGLAVASMVLGIIALAVFCIWFISIPCGVIAIILGAIAQNECGGRTPRMDGGGMAIAGLVCGSVSIALYLIALLFASFSMSAPFRFMNW